MTNKFKSVLTAVACASAVVLLTAVTGCSTTSSSASSGVQAVITPQVVESVAQVAASAGATYAIQQDTNAGPYFSLAIAVLDAGLNTGQISVTNLQAQLSKISTSTLRNPEVVTFLPQAIQALASLEGKDISSVLTSNQYVYATLAGIDNGLRSALGQPLINVVIPVPAVSTNAVGVIYVRESDDIVVLGGNTATDDTTAGTW